MMRIQLSLFIFSIFVSGAQGLSCGECNHDNTTESCGQPPSCHQTVLDACGCCPLCAKIEGELCGGPWDSLGSCADGLVCRPLTTAAPLLGAGGYYSESWDPAGTCVDPYKYQREHSPCTKLLLEYQSFLKSRGRRSADVTTEITSSNDTDDATVTTTPAKTTTIACVRKPNCTPDGKFAPLQCDGCVGECWCSFQDGMEVHDTRGPYRTVRC